MIAFFALVGVHPPLFLSSYLSDMSFLVCLPTFGDPYITKFIKKSETALAEHQDVVGGSIERFDRKKFMIHPMFESPRWRLAQRLLQDSKVTVYVNEDGANECSPNMATVITDPRLRIGGCPHLFGRVCLKVPALALNRVGITAECLKIADGYKDENNHPNWEPDDDAEIEAVRKTCSEKGYDFIESQGSIYCAKA